MVTGNMFGLGNSAARKSCLLPCHFDNDLVAIDWYYFAQVLRHKVKACFTSSTFTNYRRYIGNTVGFADITEERIITAFQVQLKHHNLMNAHDKIHGERFEALYEVYKLIKTDPDFRAKYLNKTIKHLKFPLWWQEAQTLKEFYENQN